uniref:C-type lectin domain-containing protein n=1 Tax=Timema bartmani TaxID=61472 RepID=A0A7R9F0J8_9NEOP|nr:unnamed protein product [Timema bartmani]
MTPARKQAISTEDRRMLAKIVNISNTWFLPQEGFPVFYRYFRDRITWYEADAVCQFHHANLVTAVQSFRTTNPLPLLIPPPPGLLRRSLFSLINLCMTSFTCAGPGLITSARCHGYQLLDEPYTPLQSSH